MRTFSDSKVVKGPKIFVPICAVLILVSFYYLERQNILQIGLCSKIIYEQKAEFREIKHLNGVHTFSDVCIEALATPKLENRLKMVFNETKKIVIYGNNSQADGEVIALEVAGSANSLWNHWEIHFRQQTLPAENMKLLSDTAFFVQPTCPGNIHHFFTDEFVPLYTVVVLSNRLHPGARNQLVYRTPRVDSDDDRCHSRSRYEGFLQTLYIDEFHDVFYNFPNNTCFRHAIFGNTPLLFRHRDVIDHVLRYYNLTLQSNRNANDLYVTILQRKDRRIINAEEVLSFAKEVGFTKARTVEFNNISIHDQLAVMSTTNVFIGVHGAGLQWSVFMPEGSYLIELAWPHKHWRFYYQEHILSFNITWKGVRVVDVRLNWTSYAINVRRGVPVSEAEKSRLIRKRPNDLEDSIWKWADIVVRKWEILGTLKTAYRELHMTR